jgi:exopolysaccharide production protein ExoQ
MVLAIAIAVAAPLAVYFPLGLAALLIVTTLAALGVAVATRAGLALLDRGLVAAALALCLWAGLSALWSSAPPAALSVTVRFAAVLVAGFLLAAIARRLGDDEHERLGRWLVAAVALGFAVLFFEMHAGLLLTRIFRAGADYARLDPASLVARPDRGATFLVVALWPALAILVRRGRLGLAALLFALAVAAGLSSASLAAKLALFVGAAAGGLAWAWPRLVARGLLVGLVGVSLAMPLVMRLLPDPQTLLTMAAALPYSAHHRLTIWRFTAERIAEHPLIGWGMDESRRLPGGNETMVFGRTLPDGTTQPVREQLLPLHPHNGPMQVWLELGLVGLACFLAFVALLVARIEAVPERATRATGLAAVAAGLVIYSVSYGAWQSWWISGLALVAALVAATGPAEGTRPA